MSQLLNNTNKLNQNFNIYANEVICNDLVADSTTIDGTLNVETVDAVNVNSVNGTFAKLETTTFTAVQADVDSVYFPNGTSPQVALNGIQSGTFVVSYTGACIGTGVAYYTKYYTDGNDVATVNLPAIYGSWSATTSIQVNGIPTNLRANRTSTFPVAVQDNSLFQSTPGTIYIYTNNSYFYVGKSEASPNFVGGNLVGIPNPINLTYITN